MDNSAFVELRQPRDATRTTTGWLLTGCLSIDATASRIPLVHFPFVIGRDQRCDLVIPSRNVSKRHAEILHTTGVVVVRDLGSTNGSFVNGHRIHEPTPVGDNDLLQFADVELRLCRDIQSEAEGTIVADSPEQFWEISRISKVLNEGRITIAFQPIFIGPQRKLFGFEALARTDVPGLESPLALFATAVKLGVENELSEMCRQIAVRTIEEADVPGTLFLNTHPHEPLDDTMVTSMKALREQCGTRPLVLEIHEAAVGAVEDFCWFKASLHELGIALAFDDFGVGQSRLLELSKVRPDYIKFDRSLVKDLGSPTATQSGIVASLHNHATSLGISTVAEGLETREAITACDAIGFILYQGFAFGRPQPISQIVASGQASNS